MAQKPYVTKTFTGKVGDEDVDKQIEDWLADQLKNDYMLHSISEIAVTTPANSNISGVGPPIGTVVSRVTVGKVQILTHGIL